MSHHQEYSVARLKKGQSIFEIAIDPDLAIAYREEGKGDIKDILHAEKIFSDARKGLIASGHELQAVFDTTDPLVIAEAIIRHGEIPVTAEYREKKQEEKRLRIISIIARNGVDPKTHLPHPPARIENAIAEAKVKIDPHKDADEQVREIVKKLSVVLPIRFETKEIALRVPPEYAAKSYPTVTAFGKIIKEEWLQDGSWAVVVEIPGGMENDLYDKLNTQCHGNVESKLLKTR